MKKYSLLMLLALCLAFTLQAFAQTDTIRFKDKRLLTSALKPGLRQYLIYFQTVKEQKSLRFWYWLRDIKIADRNGEKVFNITQHWFGSDTNSYRAVYSVNRVVDFAPLFHSETIKGITRAYNWAPEKITGADTVAKNAQKGFALNFTSPNFNWNLDIETFEMLPLAAGKAFAINFYDAGLSPPEYVVYKVIGSEVLTTLNNEQADCWKLFTEGDSGGKHYSETYWISKKGHEFLKEEDAYPGGFRYKLRMLNSATDIVARFDK
jgi:hypothetical protein